MKHHILMADIIHSSSQPGAQLMDALKEVVHVTNKQFSSKLKSPLTITLGDEFQGVADSLKSLIEIVFNIDKLLLSADFKLRYSINYGQIDTKINTKIAYEMLGEGLTTARNNLSTLKSTSDNLMINGYKMPLNKRLKEAFQLYYYFYNEWSDVERPVVLDFLNGNDYKKVAEHFNKDISSMWRKEKSLCIKEYHIAKSLITSLANAE